MYSCHNFRHKYINEYKNSYENPKNYYEGTYGKKPSDIFNINYNNFGALSYEIECYKSNNFGNIARTCRSNLIDPSKETR